MKNAFFARWSEKTHFPKYPFFGLWAVLAIFGAKCRASGQAKELKNVKKLLKNPAFPTFGPQKIRF